MNCSPGNRLGHFCDSFVEAGWLAIAATLPLYFNTNSVNTFEPDKVFLFRSLILIMIAAWALRKTVARRPPYELGNPPPRRRVGHLNSLVDFLKRPLLLPVLLVTATSILSTATSLEPRISFWGSYQRAQGTYTLACGIALFFFLSRGIRYRKQLFRFIDTLILASFPVALYALLQHFGQDPLPWAKTVTVRATSTQGNPIFLGAYLLLSIPLTMSRIFECWGRLIKPAGAREWFWGIGASLASGLGVLAVLLAITVIHPAWIRWGMFLGALAGQVLLYTAVPPKRLYQTLCIGLPLFFSITIAYLWRFEIFIGETSPSFLWAGLFSAGLFLSAMGALAVHYRQAVGIFLRLAVYLIIMVAQVAGILVTQSRGPLLALLATFTFYFIIYGLVKRRLWVSWLTLAIAVASTAFLVWLNTADSDTAAYVRQSKLLARLGQVSVAERTVKVRLLIWSGIMGLSEATPPPAYPDQDGRPDPHKKLRRLIGYGPETLALVYHPFYPPALAHYTPPGSIPDRAHNETLELIVTKGILGLLAYLTLMTGIIYMGLKQVGLLNNPWQKKAFWVFWCTGVLAGGLIAVSSRWPIIAGLGLPGGMIAGLGVYLTVLLVGLSRKPVKFAAPTETAEWAIAVFAALVGHMVETHIGFPTATTTFIFWAYAAMLSIPAPSLVKSNQAADALYTGTAKPLKLDPWASLITTLMLGTLIFGFLPAAMGRFGTEAVMEPSRVVPLKNFPMVLSILLPTVCAGLLMGLPSGESGSSCPYKTTRFALNELALGAAATLGICACFGFLLVAIDKSSAGSFSQAGYRQMVFFYLFVFVVVSALAAGCRSETSPATSAAPWRTRILFVGISSGILLLAVAAIYVSNVRMALADIYAREGKNREVAKQLEAAARFYQLAVNTVPEQAHYHSALGQALEAAGLSSAAPDRVRHLEKSQIAYSKALELTPYDPRNWVNLARLYSNWSLLSASPERNARFKMAGAYFNEASRRAPNDIGIYNMWGQGLVAVGDLTGAEAIYTESLQVDPEQGPTYLLLGELYVIGKNWPKAREAYGRAVELMPHSVEARSGYGFACIKNGDRELALEAYKIAVSLAPENYNDHKNLALLFQGNGEIERAISAANTALQLAPKSKQAVLSAYLRSLGNIRNEGPDP